MAIPTFVQNSRINQVIYQIRDDQLLVSARQLLGKFKDRRFDLRGLDPDYQPKITRSYFLLIAPLITMALCGLALWGLMHQAFFPGEAVVHFYMTLIVGLAGSLLAAIRGSRRIEYFQFNNQWGKPALFIIRERHQAQECAAFIATLVAHIEIAVSDLPPAERKKLIQRFAQEDANVPASAPGLDFWKVSLVCGALATLLPLWPKMDYYFPGFLFLAVFFLCLCGAASCVFSFQSKEPRRWFSLVGMVLSLIPPYFY